MSEKRQAVAVTKLVCAFAVGASIISATAGHLAARAAGAAEVCRVSSTSSHPVPGRTSFNFGNARIAVGLPKSATFSAVTDGKPGWAFIQKDGWIRTKVGWFTARGTPSVTGQRVDGTGHRLRADVGPLSFAVGDGSFYPSLLYFPSFGCWRITATAGGARLVATVSVRRSTRARSR